SGDIVFLADQDDVWDERKLEKMCEVLERQEDVRVLVCKFGLIDGEGGAIKTAMAPTHAGGTSDLRKVSAHDVFYKGEWPGMAMAYRREWYQRKVAVAELPHDLLLAAWAAEEGAFRQMDEELVWHRRHESNTGQEEHRLKKLLNKERKLREIETYLGYLDIFSRENLLCTEEGRRALEEKRKSMSGRYEALRSGKIGKVLKAAVRSRRDVRLATVVCDVIICRQKTEE
ncbi:MAG: hypothetical protein NC392_15400, partial [Roseburia sp.]|nr:hypothetical protein [Roseburia sp.]